MLGKLIKYEWKATARVFLPGYLLLLFFALMGRLTLAPGIRVSEQGYEQPFSRLQETLAGVSMMGYVFVIMGTLIITAAVVLMRFYKNLLGSEGYLMNTLPVNSHQLVLSKLLVAMGWCVLTCIAIVVSIFVLFSEPFMLRTMARGFGEFWHYWVRELGLMPGIGYILLMLLTAFVSGCSSILMVYTAISIGQTFKQHKIMGSVLAYIGLSVAASFIGSLVAVGGIFGTVFFNGNGPWQSTVVAALLVGLGLELCFSAVWYFATNYLLTTQLNLE